MGGEFVRIGERSRVELRVDGLLVDETFHDANDAWQKAVNRLLKGAVKAVITETVTIEKAEQG
jgi:hypothetical protein